MPARRVGRQLRLVPALLVPTARAVAWWPPLAAFTVSLGLLALAVRPGSVLEAEELVQWLRIAIVTGALGWAFLLDDPSEPTTEGVAGSLLLRRALRIVLLLPATAAWWVAVVSRVRAVYPGMSLPVAAFTLEASALLAVTMALAAAGSRLAPERRGGVVAAPALLALASAATLLPARIALYALPGSPGWAGAHHRWAMLLGLALAAFAAASRDPARRRLCSQLRRLTSGRLAKPADPGRARGAEEHQAGLTRARRPGTLPPRLER
jgi:fluoroquinolone transport system permease protein